MKDMKDLVLRNKIERAVEEVRATHPEGVDSFLTAWWINPFSLRNSIDN